jgi:AcrR family transcriptional regulator
LFVGYDDGPVTPAVRTPQADRTRAMRLRLLDATIELLVERGFSGTSTTLVSERAGVSRGAQLHHFPTKNDLVIAAVEHLTEVRGAELAAAAQQLPNGRRRTRAVLEMLADHFTGAVFTAALELWVAARTDPALHQAVGPLEQRIGRETHRYTVELLGVDESQPGMRELVQATLDLVRGLGLANTITDDTVRRGRILDEWAKVLDGRLFGGRAGRDSSATALRESPQRSQTNRSRSRG